MAQSNPPYVRPRTVQEAVAALPEVEGARVIAGGTDLMVALRERRVLPSRLVDITEIDDLKEIRHDGAGLVIGAAVSIYDLISHSAVRQRYPVLVDAGRLLGGWQIQNMATVAGNLCNASPAAELAGPLLVLDAHLNVTGPQGTRQILLTDFWVGPGKTRLSPGEIVTSIEIPGHVAGARSAYRRADIRHSVDIALASASARLDFQGEQIRVARLALGAVAPVPFRLKQAEQLLEQTTLSQETLKEIQQMARTEARPITDVRASADYRLAMTGVLAARVVELASARAAL